MTYTVSSGTLNPTQLNSTTPKMVFGCVWGEYPVSYTVPPNVQVKSRLCAANTCWASALNMYLE